MTIGPEPSTRILCRSSRLGMRREEVDELVEQPQGVVGAGARLGVVLHTAGGYVEQADPLDGVVVEVHGGQLRGAELGVDDLARRPRDRKAMVLAGDRDPPGPQVLDRMVRAAVAERELERLQAGGARQQLVAEADPEDRLG